MISSAVSEVPLSISSRFLFGFVHIKQLTSAAIPELSHAIEDGMDD